MVALNQKHQADGAEAGRGDQSVEEVWDITDYMHHAG